MTAKLFGNRSNTIRGSGSGISGIGSPQGSSLVGWNAISGKVGDVALIQVSSLLNHTWSVGFYFQCTGAVDVSFTLANWMEATNPDPVVQATIPWVEKLSLVPGTIESFEKCFSAMRVEFKAAGVLYVIAE